jgi:GNAT superfamily N-acetyltransferase
MIFREATIADIQQMQVVRNAVKENVLSNPDLVKDEDYVPFITTGGKGWVCTINEVVVGFSIIDFEKHNVWALFVHPTVEAKGIGKQLHKLMLYWYFANTDVTIWLSTAPGTRAEKFYTLKGWKAVGIYGKGETKFEMKKQDWLDE